MKWQKKTTNGMINCTPPITADDETKASELHLAEILERGVHVNQRDNVSWFPSMVLVAKVLNSFGLAEDIAICLCPFWHAVGKLPFSSFLSFLSCRRNVEAAIRFREQFGMVSEVMRLSIVLSDALSTKLLPGTSRSRRDPWSTMASGNLKLFLFQEL